MEKGAACKGKAEKIEKKLYAYNRSETESIKKE